MYWIFSWINMDKPSVNPMFKISTTILQYLHTVSTRLWICLFKSRHYSGFPSRINCLNVHMKILCEHNNLCFFINHHGQNQCLISYVMNLAQNTQLHLISNTHLASNFVLCKTLIASWHEIFCILLQIFLSLILIWIV